MEGEARFTVRLLNKRDEIPYDLLLLADETKEAIDKYITSSDVLVAEKTNLIEGVYVLQALNKFQMEIKNIAVATELQGRGIGRFLLKDAECRARRAGFQEIIVGTPESSHRLLAFYEKAGFSKYDRRVNFYIQQLSGANYRKWRAASRYDFAKEIRESQIKGWEAKAKNPFKPIV